MTAPHTSPTPGDVKPGTVEHRVEAGDCVHRGGYDVLATPSVVRLLEEAAMVAIEPLLGSGQNSVGTTVDIVHARPTLRGQRVTATATVVEIDRSRIVTTIEVFDDAERVAHGRHERFLVDDADFRARLKQKAERAAETEGDEVTAPAYRAGAPTCRCSAKPSARTCQVLDASGGAAFPDVERLRAALAARMPADLPPVLVHGAFRLDNLLIDDCDRVAAIVDWEMATLGDPLTDLAVLATYQGPGRARRGS